MKKAFLLLLCGLLLGFVVQTVSAVTVAPTADQQTVLNVFAGNQLTTNPVDLAPVATIEAVAVVSNQIYLKVKGNPPDTGQSVVLFHTLQNVSINYITLIIPLDLVNWRQEVNRQSHGKRSAESAKEVCSLLGSKSEPGDTFYKYKLMTKKVAA